MAHQSAMSCLSVAKTPNEGGRHETHLLNTAAAVSREQTAEKVAVVAMKILLIGAVPHGMVEEVNMKLLVRPLCQKQSSQCPVVVCTTGCPSAQLSSSIVPPLHDGTTGSMVFGTTVCGAWLL